MKNKIICIVGESGSGKNWVANHLEEEYNIPQLISRTTRPKRHPDEKGYIFVSDKEFDRYQMDEMVAFTIFGDHRYACLFKDIPDKVDIMSFICDENGLTYLRQQHSDYFDIFAFRLFAAEYKRLILVGEERIERDNNMFLLPYHEFDYIIDNTTFEDTDRKICKMMIRIYQKFKN